MATVIRKQATAGRDFMNSLLSTLSQKQQKDIAEKEAALKERYYDILGSEAGRKADLAVLQKQAAEIKLQSDKFALKEQKRMNKVYKANPLLMGQQMQAELTSKSNKQEMDLMRLMIQQSTQQIQGLNQQLTQNKFAYQQDKDRTNFLMNTFLNPDATDAMKKALGEGEFERKKGQAMGEVYGIDMRNVPIKPGIGKKILGKVTLGALGETETKALTYEETAIEFQRENVSDLDFWVSWKDVLIKQGYTYSEKNGLILRRGPSLQDVREWDAGKGVNISGPEAIDKILREDK